MLSQRLYSLQVILSPPLFVSMWNIVYWNIAYSVCLPFIFHCNGKKHGLSTDFKYVPSCYFLVSVFRPSYHSRTVTLSCSGPRWRSGPPCLAATEGTCSWSRRSSGPWPCREKSWPASTSCSLSTGWSSSAGRGRGSGTGSRWRPPRPGSDKGRRSVGGWRWSSVLPEGCGTDCNGERYVWNFMNLQLHFIFKFMLPLFVWFVMKSSCFSSFLYHLSVQYVQFAHW